LRYIGFGKETTYGTLAAPDKFFDMVRHSVRCIRELASAETMAYRTDRGDYVTTVRVEGDLEGLADPNVLARLLYHNLGDVTTTPDSGTAPVAYKHEFTPVGIGASLPSCTIELGDGGDTVRYAKGCGIATLNLEAAAGELVTFTASVIGQDEELAAKSTTITFDDLRPFRYFEGTLTRAGADISAKVQAFRITIANGIPDDAYTLAAKHLAKLYIQELSITGEIEIVFEDWEDYKRFYGSETATEPQDTVTPFALNFKLTGDTTESSVSGYENYQVEFDLPQVKYTGAESPFEQRNRIVQTFAWKATHDKSKGYAIKAIVINTNSEP